LMCAVIAAPQVSVERKEWGPPGKEGGGWGRGRGAGVGKVECDKD